MSGWTREQAIRDVLEASDEGIGRCFGIDPETPATFLNADRPGECVSEHLTWDELDSLVESNAPTDVASDTAALGDGFWVCVGPRREAWSLVRRGNLILAVFRVLTGHYRVVLLGRYVSTNGQPSKALRDRWYSAAHDIVRVLAEHTPNEPRCLDGLPEREDGL